MTDMQVGVAVIGCGIWGKNHVRVWNELGCLRAVCDSDLDRLQAVAARYAAIDTCTRIADVLEQPGVKAVVVATPAPTHAAVAAEAMEAGKDVLVEKPLALTGAEGQRLVEMAAQLQRVLMVGHVLEYHPAFRKLRQLVDSGDLGRVEYMYSNRLNLGRIRTEENALWSFAPHDVAMLLRLVGKMPEEVSCAGEGYLNQEVADITLTNLRFSNGVRAHLFVSWLHPFKEHRFVVVGDRQMAVFDDTRPWPEKLVLYPHRIDWVNGQVPVAHKAGAENVSVEEAEPLRAECEHFLECVRTRERPLSDGVSGLDVLLVLEAAQESLKLRGLPQRLDDLAPREQGYQAHSSATIDRGAEIGNGTRIWHYSHVMTGARIGRDCVLGQNVFVGRNVRIGDGVKIQNNVSVYEGVELEDYVFCGPSMVFTNVINPRSEIERKDEFRRTLVRRGASLGASCTLICGTTIGRHAFVGAGALVTRNVPDHALVVGVPARVVGWVCQCAERLRFRDGTAVCTECGRRYRRLTDGRVGPDPA